MKPLTERSPLKQKASRATRQYPLISRMLRKNTYGRHRMILTNQALGDTGEKVFFEGIRAVAQKPKLAFGLLSDADEHATLFTDIKCVIKPGHNHGKKQKIEAGGP